MEELGLPTMIKAYLLPSFSLSSSFPRMIASFHNLGTKAAIIISMGLPHQILNEHCKRVENTESGEMSKNIFYALYRFFAWTVTYCNFRIG